ncbi:MAG: DUF4129 domain-containing protein, partial [Tumebacillaceae bacterium]
FFLMALALGIMMYGNASSVKQRTRIALMLFGALVLLAGLGSLLLMRAQVTGMDFMQEAGFALLGFFLLRRMVMMLQDIKYVRQSLLENYRNDLVLIVLFTLFLVFLIGQDLTWQQKMLPFFAGFLLTRMVALSLASQLTQQQNMRKSLSEKFQRRTPFLLIAGGLLLIWIMSVIGGPLWGVVMRVLTPLFSGLYYALAQTQLATGVPEWIKWICAKLSMYLTEFLCWINGGMCKSPQQQVQVTPSPREKQMLPPVETADWLWLKVIVGVVVAAGLMFYLYKVMQRASRLRIQEGAVEIREFIQRESTKTSRTRTTSGPLTPMRKTYRKFLLAMQKAGFVRSESETASELIGKVALSSPEQGAQLDELTEYYMRERYGNRSVEAQLPRAEQLTQELTQEQKNRKK